jgi:hypothetical protein
LNPPEELIGGVPRRLLLLGDLDPSPLDPDRGRLLPAVAPPELELATFATLGNGGVRLSLALTDEEVDGRSAPPGDRPSTPPPFRSLNLRDDDVEAEATDLPAAAGR